MKMYCTGCDWSYDSIPTATMPSACPQCGSMAFASWPRHMMAPTLPGLITSLPGHPGTGATCATCGFRYWEHDGHIIPCPVCRLRALAMRVLQSQLYSLDGEVQQLVDDALARKKGT